MALQVHFFLCYNGQSQIRHSKTSDFFEVKFRCFAPKVRRFASKKSDVLHFRSLLLQKKFFVFLLHFLHQSLRTPLYIGNFRWRIGCRIRGGCRIHPALSVSFILFFLFFSLFLPSISDISLWFRAECSTKLLGYWAFLRWLIGKAFKVGSIVLASSIVDK